MSAQLPPPLITWLAGDGGRTVVVLGGPRLEGLAAGLEAAGHEVLLPQPNDALTATEARLPYGDRTVDLVVVPEYPDNVDEIVRVLREKGHLALLVNDRDHRIPWARKLDGALESEPEEEPAHPMVLSDRFGFVDSSEHRYWQEINRNGLVELLETLPEITGADEGAAERRRTAALALYDDYGRGNDGMRLPWVARCFKAVVIPPEPAPVATPEPAGQESADQEASGGTGGTDGDTAERNDETRERPRVADVPPSDGGDADMLLIDFR